MIWYARIAFPTIIIMITNYTLFCHENWLCDEWDHKWNEILNYICISILILPIMGYAFYEAVMFIYF